MYTDSTNRVFFIELNYFSFNGCCQEADILELDEMGKSNGVDGKNDFGLFLTLFFLFSSIQFFWKYP